MIPNSPHFSPRPSGSREASHPLPRRGNARRRGATFFFWFSAWAIWIAIGLGLGILAMPMSDARAEPVMFDGIAAQVGTEIVLMSEVQVFILERRLQRQLQGLSIKRV